MSRNGTLAFREGPLALVVTISIYDSDDHRPVASAQGSKLHSQVDILSKHRHDAAPVLFVVPPPAATVALFPSYSVRLMSLDSLLCSAKCGWKFPDYKWNVKCLQGSLAFFILWRTTWLAQLSSSEEDVSEGDERERGWVMGSWWPAWVVLVLAGQWSHCKGH